MGTAVYDTGKGRGKCVGVGAFIYGCGPVGTYLWVLDMDTDPPHGLDAGAVFVTEWTIL